MRTLAELAEMPCPHKIVGITDPDYPPLHANCECKGTRLHPATAPLRGEHDWHFWNRWECHKCKENAMRLNESTPYCLDESLDALVAVAANLGAVGVFFYPPSEVAPGWGCHVQIGGLLEGGRIYHGKTSETPHEALVAALSAYVDEVVG